ncbi:hypothetical protein [Streptomyces sp. AK08-02]|uniref:hypothetical protein n=1 Tax=Streptomyces sp. AK08-02 TaxID=3028654 RepID=UPI0029B6878E|nr:hypothetical protein [Streptomyces sp. AK08-02]MDX3747450.1 hypothetical protein [Streptomyces sp. AK08-02]
MGRAVGPGEPLWLAEDRAWAFALLDVEADACPECRQPWGEATDAANEFSYRAELIRCHACTASATAVKAYQDKGGKSEGLHVHIERRP